MPTIDDGVLDRSRLGPDVPATDGLRYASTTREEKAAPIPFSLVPQTSTKGEIAHKNTPSRWTTSSPATLVGATRYRFTSALSSNVIILALNLYQDAISNRCSCVSAAPSELQRCDESLSTLQSNPSGSYSCLFRTKAFFVANILLILLYWTMAMSLFHYGRWKKYYPRVFVGVVFSTILASFHVGDIATLFILVIPTVLSTCMIACYFVDIYHRS